MHCGYNVVGEKSSVIFSHGHEDSALMQSNSIDSRQPVMYLHFRYNIAAIVLDLHASDIPNTDAYLKLKNHNP